MGGSWSRGFCEASAMGTIAMCYCYAPRVTHVGAIPSRPFLITPEVINIVVPLIV